MTTPTVSVIIPVYNAARFLAATIDSVLAQTFVDFELILIDDGSTDESVAIINEYSDPRIHLAEQANAERAVARNHGLRLARGRLITFLDADDLFLPHKLAVQVAALDANPALGLVAGGNQYIDADGRVLSFTRPWEVTPSLALDTWLAGCPVWLPHTLVRREWADRAGSFDPQTVPAEDYDWLLRLAYAGCPMGWTKQSVWSYRIHANNSIRNAGRVNVGHLTVIDKLLSRPDLPPAIERQRAAILQQQTRNAALRAYDAGDLTTAQKLMQEFAAAQVWSRDAARGLAREFGRIACSPIWQSAPLPFLQRIWDNLPAGAATLLPWRKTAIAQAQRELFFRAWHEGDRPQLHQRFRAVLTSDARLIDRGMVAILLRRGVQPRATRAAD